MIDLIGTPWRWIELQRGLVTLIDADDYDWISQHGWNAGSHLKTPWKYYVKRNVGPARSTIYLHREILRRAWPDQLELAATHHGDHENGNSLDNRKGNLRWLTPAENRRHQVRRVPGLDEIAARLVAGLAAPEDVPFDPIAPFASIAV